MRAGAAAWGLAALLLLATLGEGGGSPGGLLATHAALALLLLAALALPPLDPEARTRPAAPLRGTLLVLGALALASAMLAPYRFAALLALEEIAAFAAVVSLAARCGPRLPERLSWPLLLGAAAQGAALLVQRLRGDPFPAGTFLNPSHAAAWLVAALLVGVGGGSGAETRRTRGLKAALAAPGALAVVVTGSRGALLGAAVGGGWLLHRIVLRSTPRARRILLGAAAVVLVAMTAGVTWRFLRGDPFAYQRVSIWRASVGAVARAPWLGAGPGQFKVEAASLNFPLAGAPLRYARTFQNTHSDLLRLPCELGVPALLVALAGGAVVARIAGRRLRDGALPPSATVAAAAVLALAAQATVENLSDRPAVYLLAAALLGSLLAETARGVTAVSGRLRASAALALLVAFAAADAAPYLAWRTSHSLPHGRLDAAGRARLDAALAWNPMQPDLWLRRAEDLLAAERGLDGRVYAEARECAERAVRLQPADALYRVGLARVEARACAALFRDQATRERAAAAYDTAADLDRHDPLPLLEKSGFLLDTGDPDGARRAAERALRIEPEAIPARLLLAECALADGGPGAGERAARLLDEARAVARKWSRWPKSSGYEMRLLILDDARARAIRRRIDALAAPAVRGGGGATSSGAPALRGRRDSGDPRSDFG